MDEKTRSAIAKTAQGILDARVLYPDRSLADLYNRDTMPDRLREEHRKLDELVERAYKETPFANDEERLSHLLNRYKKMVGK